MGVMEDSEQQQPSIVLKHYCKVCKRGFGCAGALGGHMRSHGVGGDARIRHPISGEDKCIGDMNYKKSAGSKHSYFLRKTNRFTSYRASEDPDKMPSSVRPGCNERGKCTKDEMFLSLSSSESEDEGITLKSRRTKSGKYDVNYYDASSEEEDLANCLVMLSNKSFVLSDKEENKAKEVEKGMFQCKACKKVFNSHQALGGHRASHKKVKGCYAAKFSNTNEADNAEDELINHDKLFVESDSLEPGVDLDQSVHILPTSTTSKRKFKEHECSICHRVFSSGQALGGHKRCHWLTTNLPDNTIIQNLQDQFQFDSPPFFKKPMLRKTENLDLNSPPLLLDNVAIDHGNTNSSSNNNPFKYDGPARIFLQLWGSEQVENSNHNQQQEKLQGKQIMHDSLDDLDSDEACRVKLAKLSELKDMNVDGGSSGWLKVGIATTAEMTATP